MHAETDMYKKISASVIVGILNSKVRVFPAIERHKGNISAGAIEQMDKKAKQTTSIDPNNLKDQNSSNMIMTEESAVTHSDPESEPACSNLSITTEQMSLLLGGNEINAKFFRREAKGTGIGYRHLLQKVFDIGGNVDVTSQVIIFCLELDTLLLHLTKVDRERLAFLVGCTVDRGDPGENIFLTIWVPRSVSDSDKILLKGPKFIIQNLPYPMFIFQVMVVMHLSTSQMCLLIIWSWIHSLRFYFLS